MRNSKVKRMRRDLRSYDQAHPVLAVVWPRSWYGKGYRLTRVTVLRVVLFILGLRRRPRLSWRELCETYQAGKVIRLEPKFRDLKRTMRGKHLD